MPKRNRPHSLRRVLTLVLRLAEFPGLAPLYPPTPFPHASGGKGELGLEVPRPACVGEGFRVRGNVLSQARLLIPALVLALILSGCGGLAGEPQIVSTSALPTVTPTAPPDLGHPRAAISLADGAQIFGDTQTG